MYVKGRVIKYGDNIDTDVIIPARYLNTSDRRELAAHCMEDLDKTFVKRVRPGDILVAGKNFGCGSSREHAPIAIKESGIAAVVAKSFARIFYRNAINTGLPIVEYDGEIDEEDEIAIDFDNGRIYNINKGTQGSFPPFPPFLQKIINAGGLLNSLKGD
jgi:3-isopropylmalate dehydratase small subunit